MLKNIACKRQYKNKVITYLFISILLIKILDCNAVSLERKSDINTNKGQEDYIYLPVLNISGEFLRSDNIIIEGSDIDKFGVINPVDIFKTTPGVLSGEARSSGALDVNIRGLQGQGRILTTVDGSTNQTALYRGYQGVSNRTYISPDFIGKVYISKGPAEKGIGSIGGAVEISTLNAEDILLPGRNIGLRLKGDIMNNHSNQKNYEQNNSPSPSKDSLLTAKNRTGSIVFAYADSTYEFLAGFSKRLRGNYHSGKHGYGLSDYKHPGYLCNPDFPDECDRFEFNPIKAAYSIYPKGKAVPNTSEDTTSQLLKVSTKFGDGHKISSIFSRYNSSFGETYVADSVNVSPGSSVIIWQGARANLNLLRYNLDYEWNPATNPLVNLKLGWWKTIVKDKPKISMDKLGDQKFTNTFGFNFSNTSLFDINKQPLDIEYGMSLMKERTGPSSGKWENFPKQREGSRQEYRVFINSEYQITDHLTLKTGLDHKRYKLNDQSDSIMWSHGLISRNINSRKEKAYGYNMEGDYKITDNTTFYVRHAKSPRFPSLVEGARGFMMSVDDNIHHETAKHFESGVSASFKDFLLSNRIDLNLSYFHTTIDDYISRTWVVNNLGQSMYISNIKAAKFSGIEFLGSYYTDDFDAKLSMNYYTKVNFCTEDAGCVKHNIASDYATNHIPPKYAITLNLTKRFFDDRITIDAIASHYGTRAIDAAKVGHGSAPLLAPVIWRPATIVDTSIMLKINPNLQLNLGINNIFDRYYIQPLSLGYIPSPGRTVKAGVTAYF